MGLGRDLVGDLEDRVVREGRDPFVAVSLTVGGQVTERPDVGLRD